MNADVIVAGAGAIGSICAKECARAGLKTLVLEEHPAVGKGGKCTALVSQNGLRSLGVSFEKTVLNEVAGARIFSPNFDLSVRTEKTQACVLDRQAFDEQCAAEAQDAGAHLVLKTRVEKIVQERVRVVAKTNMGAFSAKVLVGCDGVSSVVAQSAGFPAFSAEKIVVGWEGEFEKALVEDERSVCVFLDAQNYPGFFGWAVPVSQNTVRVGCAVRGASLDSAKRFLLSNARVAQVISHAKKTREFTHSIPLAVREKTTSGRVLLCGDAAGQVKATTGGGVVFGGLCAIEAARSAKDFLDSGSGVLDYELRWRKKFGKTLALHSAVRNSLNAIDNSALNALVLSSKVFGAGFLLSHFGDMDFVFRS